MQFRIYFPQAEATGLISLGCPKFNRYGIAREEAGNVKMSRQSIEQLAHRWMSFWQGADLDGFESVHDTGFVDHSAGDRGEDRRSFRNAVAELYQTFSGFDAQVDVMVIDEDAGLAAIRWTATGRHTGPFEGIDATNRDIVIHASRSSAVPEILSSSAGANGIKARYYSSCGRRLGRSGLGHGVPRRDRLRRGHHIQQLRRGRDLTKLEP